MAPIVSHGPSVGGGSSSRARADLSAAWGASVPGRPGRSRRARGRMACARTDPRPLETAHRSGDDRIDAFAPPHELASQRRAAARKERTMTATPGIDQTADDPETSDAPAVERRFLRSRTNRVLAGVCGGDRGVLRLRCHGGPPAGRGDRGVHRDLSAVVPVPHCRDRCARAARRHDARRRADRRRRGTDPRRGSRDSGCSSSRWASSRLRTSSCWSTGTSCGRSYWSPSEAA